IDISHSQATFGGAIWEQSGTLTMTHSEFISNTAAVGGAIEQTGGGSIIASSSFSQNVATIAGALRMINGNCLALNASLFDGNLADGGGGAILVQGLNAQASIDRSTFTHNQMLAATPLVGGGAIINDGVLTMTNSTLANNGSLSDGAGLYIDSG